jgi:hypothetical protein
VDDPLSVHEAQVIRESSTVRGGLSEKVGEKKDTCSFEIDVWLGVESIEKRRRQRVPEGAVDFREEVSAFGQSARETVQLQTWPIRGDVIHESLMDDSCERSEYRTHSGQLAGVANPNPNT